MWSFYILQFTMISIYWLKIFWAGRLFFSVVFCVFVLVNSMVAFLCPFPFCCNRLIKFSAAKGCCKKYYELLQLHHWEKWKGLPAKKSILPFVKNVSCIFENIFLGLLQTYCEVKSAVGGGRSASECKQRNLICNKQKTVKAAEMKSNLLHYEFLIF